MSAGKQFAQAVSKLAGRVALAGGVLGGGSVVTNYCLYNVDAGEAAVLFDQLRGGVQPDTRMEGTHFRIPYFQTPIVYSIRAKPHVVSTATPTKDMQTISIALRVLCRPVAAELPYIHKELGLQYDERVLPSIVNDVLKSVVAQYNADELITMREKVSKLIREQLNARAKSFNLELDDVSITHLAFGTDFTLSVEAKQVAQQDSERAKFVVDKNEQEKKAKVIKAEGDALAATLISDSIKQHGDGFIEVRRIDAAKEIAANLAQNRNVVYLPAGDGNVSMLLSGQ